MNLLATRLSTKLSGRSASTGHYAQMEGLAAADAGTAADAGPRRPLSAGAKLKLTAAFARQMQVLVGTGIPLASALHATERQARTASFKTVIRRMAKVVDEGTPLSIAMAESGVFDAVAISLVAAGESSGSMGQMLSRLADLKRRQLKLRTTITAALVYPAMLLTMGFGVMLTLLLFVIPRFKVLFTSLDSPLPESTKFLLAVSEFIQVYWWACLLGVAAVGGGVYYALVSPAGRALFDRHYLRVPMIGYLGRSLLSARIARMLGTLLDAKVPLTEALELTRRSAVNLEYAALIGRAEDAVSRGQPLSMVIEDNDLLIPGVQEAIRNGEATGRLGEPLTQMADFLDEENDVALKSLTTAIEPLILIVLGVVVGGIAMSIFLPMFDMITAAQGGH